MQHIGKYNVIKKLGSGSFGFVYLAEDPKLQLQVAIKVFKIKDVTLMSQVTSAAEDPVHVIKQRFIDEARTLRKLSANPYIIEMYEFDELPDGTPYYVMPFISRTLVDEIGRDAFSQGMLDDIAKADFPRRLATTQAINYLKQLTQALCAVHEHGLVHRDIKPENILITEENQLQLSDFGIAKLPLSEHSQTGFGMGSKNYLSPEQQESAKHVQASSDIYSLGVIAYRMFTGHLPVARFQDPISFAPDMPQALNDLIILAISQIPSQRPCDGAQFLQLLNQAIKETSEEKQQHTEEGTAIWAAQTTNPIKAELKPLENKIIALLKQYGEIKPSDLILLQTLADIVHIDEIALQEFITHVTQLQQKKSNNSDHKLASFILWVNTVNKHVNAHINSHSKYNHKQCLPDALVDSLITAGLSTTDKTAEQLTALIKEKQQKTPPIKQIKLTVHPLFKQIKKRALPLLLLLVFIGLTLLYGQYQTQEKISIVDAAAWEQAKSNNTETAYLLYLESKPEGSYAVLAKQALTQLLQQKDNSKRNAAIAQEKLINAIQQQLIKQGYQISPTGKLDQRTKQAIQIFEQSQDLLITGNVDALLLKILTHTYQEKDEKDWLAAHNKHTVDAYQQYKVAFPQGQHFMQASLLIKQLAIEKSNNEKQKKQAQAKQRKQLIEITTNELLDNMITLPAANFIMGCTQGSQCNDKEIPQHNVSISTFDIMATEVTFAQWDTCVTSGACSLRPDDQSWGRGNRPVIEISYHDIVDEFIPWLNKVTGKKFALPSETQWEYAAKANSKTKYAWGNEPDCLKARYGQFSGLCGNERKTSPIKSFRPNAFGLYDMHGNVWEWTQDCWNENYTASPTDGSARKTGDCNAGVIRGGSWLNEAKLLGSTFRSGYNRQSKANVNGFRLVINTTK